MKKLIVSPSKIITRDLAVYDIEKLTRYYRQITSGGQVHPIFVVDLNLYPIKKFRQDLEKKKEDFTELEFGILSFNSGKLEEGLDYKIKRGAKYLLCDGNHRGIAYTLAGLDIPAEQIERFEDIREIIKELGDKALFTMHRNRSMRQFLFKQYRGICWGAFRQLYTIEDKVSILRRSNELKLENGVITYNPDTPF